MEYFTNLLKKAFKSVVVTTLLIAVLWGALYHLTDFATVASYVLAGIVVCAINTAIRNIRMHKFESIISVQGNWVVMAGAVLVLYHAGFIPAAVFVAAAIFVSPFFWATICEGIVGLSLLAALAWQLS